MSLATSSENIASLFGKDFSVTVAGQTQRCVTVNKKIRIAVTKNENRLVLRLHATGSSRTAHLTLLTV